MVTVRVAKMRGGEGSWIIATLMVVMGTCSRSVLQVVLKSVVVARSGGAESLAPMLMLSAGGFTCEVVAELVPLALVESDVGPGAGGTVADEIGGRVLLDAEEGLPVCDDADVGCESGIAESLIGAPDVVFGSGCGEGSGDNVEDPVDDISWTMLGKAGWPESDKLVGISPGGERTLPLIIDVASLNVTETSLTRLDTWLEDTGVPADTRVSGIDVVISEVVWALEVSNVVMRDAVSSEEFPKL